MEETTATTLEKIQEAAMDEFLDKGFLGASLRQIVKNAGVTTGAFYGYFSSKEAVVSPAAPGTVTAATPMISLLPLLLRPQTSAVFSSGVSF